MRRLPDPGLAALSDEELQAANQAVRHDLDDRYHPHRDETAHHALKQKFEQELRARGL